MWTIPDTVGSDLPQVLVIAVFHEPPSATSARWWERWRSHLISRAEQNRLIGTTVDAASESNGCHLLVVGDDATTVRDLALSITYRAGINGTDVGSTLYTYAGKKTLAEVPATPATGLEEHGDTTVLATEDGRTGLRCSFRQRRAGRSISVHPSMGSWAIRVAGPAGAVLAARWSQPERLRWGRRIVQLAGLRGAGFRGRGPPRLRDSAWSVAHGSG